MNWPIGCGKEFQGVYDRQNRKIIHFTSNTNAKGGHRHRDRAGRPGPGRPHRPGQAGTSSPTRSSCWTGPPATFDMDRVRHGKLSPVFFGSALTNFGVEPFLEEFLRMTTAAPAPEGGRGDHRLL